MRINNKYIALAMAAVACGGFSACNDTLEALPLEYKEDPNFAPPHIQDEWNLEEISGMTETNVYAYKDKMYNALFTRTLGWNGGDGVLTVGLPDGHVLWTFNDSFYGVADAETRARGNCSFPRNSIMVQTAEDGMPVGKEENLLWMADWIQTSDPTAYGYYKARTHVDHPRAASYNDDGIAQDYLYWSGDGTIVGNKLQLIWMGVYTPGNGDMLNQNAALAIYSIDGKPGDPGYMKLESIDHNWIPENPYGYGSTLLECEDGHLYLYSSTGNGQFLGNVPIVARTMPWVFKKGDWYYMLAQTFPFVQELTIMRSENPWGPFSDKKVLLKFPNPLDELQHGAYNHLYMLNYHPALSREGRPIPIAPISGTTSMPPAHVTGIARSSTAYSSGREPLRTKDFD